MVVARYEGAALADEEIQVRTLVGLQHMVEIELPVAPAQRWLGLPPLLLSFLTAWRQADRRLSAAILRAREKAKKEKLLSQLEKPPGNPIEPSDQLKGYNKVARSKNAN